MPKIFLSYSHKNKKFMDRLKEDIEHEGIKVWVDEEELKKGSPEWTFKIEGAIKRADCMVVLCSPEANKSRWVKKEIHYALEFDCPICPVLIEGNARSAIPITVIDIDRIDARSRYSQALPMIISAIREGKADIPKTPPPGTEYQKHREIIRALTRMGSTGSGMVGRIYVKAFYGSDSKPYLWGVISPIDDRDALEASQQLELRGWEIRALKLPPLQALGAKNKRVKGFVYTWSLPRKPSQTLLTQSQINRLMGQADKSPSTSPRPMENKILYDIAEEILLVNGLLGLWPEDIEVRIDV